MIGCAACGTLAAGGLCPGCRATLAPGGVVVTGLGIVVTAGLVHRGTARRLVHNLKYRGIRGAAEPLADAMAGRIGDGASALVPVPRASLRTMRFGIDPAVVLARAVGRRCALPVVDALRPAMWWPRHATRDPERRAPPRFHVAAPVPAGAWLVDDVSRTGSTIDAAAGALGLSDLHGLAATAPSSIEVPAWRSAGRLTER